MIVAGIQMDIVWEGPEENFRRVERKVERIMDGQPSDSSRSSTTPPPRLLVLPEMFATGFSMNTEVVSGFASETRAFLSELASEHSVFVLGGYAEPADPLPANVCSIFAPSGEEVLHFQKLHPFSMAEEDRHYRAGESVPTVEVEGVRVTPFICYDLRFPEPFRPVASGTDLYCVIANWPDKRRSAWSTLLRSRAIENQAYVIGVNRVGMGSGLPHAGDSVLVDPMGDVVAEATEYEEGTVLGEVDPREVTKVRRHLPFLKDRRPALYGNLEPGSF
ncbi:MAG: carbon-nitrogen family hydrolase [Gemmatimonadetes bacterium]|nr:carbon-nitrogen family hydrolase [Gemmatimonadota bacterium]